MLEEKRRNLFWTPCTAYCIDRMLEDFAKIEYVGVCLGKSEKGHVLHSHASSVPLFDGTNYSVWHEKVEFMLGVLELDLVLLPENRAELTDESTEDNKDLHKLWEECNRLSLMFMRIKISATIKASLREKELTKDFMKSVAERWNLMNHLTTMKCDGTRSMYNHETEMQNIAAKLKDLGMTMNDSLLAQFILDSLPDQYGPFQVHFTMNKGRWRMDELGNQVYMEEGRLALQSVAQGANH